MLEEQSQMKQLDKSWKIILLIWSAIFSSLGVYLIVCHAFGNQFQSGVGPNFPTAILKNIFLVVSIIILFTVRYLRGYLMRPGGSPLQPSQVPSVQHSAIGKYTLATLITSALLESIGIYGVVLFLLTKDNSLLYLFLIISAAGMIYFRPRKDELSSLMAAMKV